MSEAQRLVDEAQQLIASLALFAPNDAEREVTIVAARLSGVVNRLALAEQASGKAQQAAEPQSVARIAAITGNEIHLVWHIAMSDLAHHGLVENALLYTTPPETPAAQQVSEALEEARQMILSEPTVMDGWITKQDAAQHVSDAIAAFTTHPAPVAAQQAAAPTKEFFGIEAMGPAQAQQAVGSEPVAEVISPISPESQVRFFSMQKVGTKLYAHPPSDQASEKGDA